MNIYTTIMNKTHEITHIILDKKIPNIGDICTNNVHNFFIWTAEHEKLNVLQNLVEYKNTKVIQLLVLSNDKIMYNDWYLNENKTFLNRNILQKELNNSFKDSKKIIASYPLLSCPIDYDDITYMPIYEYCLLLNMDFIKKWINKPINKINVLYNIENNQETLSVNINEIVCDFIKFNKFDWEFERSSGFAGYRNKITNEWIYESQYNEFLNY